MIARLRPLRPWPVDGEDEYDEHERDKDDKQNHLQTDQIWSKMIVNIIKLIAS